MSATCPEDTYVMCGIPATPLPEPRTVQLVTDLATTGGPHPAIILALIAAGLALLAIGVALLGMRRPRPVEKAAPYVDIVFDGPPEHEAGRFVEVENERGESVAVGEWIDREDGYWSLRIRLEATR